MNDRTLRSMAWGAHTIAILICVFAFYSQTRAIQEANDDLRSAQKRITEATNKRKAAEAAGDDPRFAVLEKGALEESVFVEEVRSKVGAHGLQLVTMGGAMESLVETGSMPEEEQKRLRGIGEIKTNVIVRGSYASIRAFLRSLNRGARLVNVRSARVERKDEAIELALTVSRYVRAPQGDAK